MHGLLCTPPCVTFQRPCRRRPLSTNAVCTACSVPPPVSLFKDHAAADLLVQMQYARPALHPACVTVQRTCRCRPLSTNAVCSMHSLLCNAPRPPCFAFQRPCRCRPLSTNAGCTACSAPPPVSLFKDDGAADLLVQMQQYARPALHPLCATFQRPCRCRPPSTNAQNARPTLHPPLCHVSDTMPLQTS